MKYLENFKNSLIENIIKKFPKELYLNESLIKSWEYKDIIKYIDRLFTKNKIKFNYNLNDFSLDINIDRKELNYNYSIIDKFKNILHLAGYRVSNYKLDSQTSEKGFPNNNVLYSNYSILKLTLNKNFDTEKEGIPIKLYHVTEESNLSKIYKKGIYPLSLNKLEEHPNRVYIFDNIDSAKYYVNILKSSGLQNLVILELDSRLNDKLILRYDPKFGGEKSDFGAYYTDNHFSPLSIINEIYV